MPKVRSLDPNAELRKKVFGTIKPNYKWLSDHTGIAATTLARYYKDPKLITLGRLIRICKAREEELKIGEKKL